jgi:hypothetical protein
MRAALRDRSLATVISLARVPLMRALLPNNSQLSKSF